MNGKYEMKLYRLDESYSQKVMEYVQESIHADHEGFTDVEKKVIQAFLDDMYLYVTYAGK